MGETTNKLLAMAKKVGTEIPKRELDVLLATGEQQTVALLAIALQNLGIEAQSRYYLTSLNTSGGLTSFFNREPYRCPSVITSNNSFPNYSNFINVFSFLDCIIAPCFLYCKSFLKIYIIQGIS